MKILFSFLFLISAINQKVIAQEEGFAKYKKEKAPKDFPNFDSVLVLENIADTTANISFGDFDGDGNPDMLLVKGRHWPIVDRLMLGDGKGGVRKAYDLGKISDRSYTGAVADFNGDGFPDIAVSNDAPDKKLVYFNDGKGNFSIGSEFGKPEWPTRNLAVADINKDGLPDLILANRGRNPTYNYICLNKGQGKFEKEGIPFAPYPATTIAPVHFNEDGFIDLVVPHRDGGQSYIYPGNSSYTFSDDRRIPFGPADAVIRMAAVADFDGDNFLDIVAIDENKGASIYFGQKDKSFAEGISIADKTVSPYALAIADLNKDGKVDIIIGNVKSASNIYFNEGKSRSFITVSFGDAKGTVYGLTVGDFNKDGIADIAAARSEAPSVLYFGNVKTKKRKRK